VARQQQLRARAGAGRLRGHQAQSEWGCLVWQGCRRSTHDGALTPRCAAQDIVVEELISEVVSTRCGRTAKRLRLA
jgi:hypothetical protein